MKPGDTCYIQQNGKWFEYTFVNAYDWQDAVRVQNGVGEMTCKASELIDKEQYEKIITDERRAELSVLYKPVIDLYGAGPEKPTAYYRSKHTRSIANRLGRSVSSVGQEIACAKRWGLIKDEKSPVD